MERRVSYLRHEFHFPDPEPRDAPLSVFLFDVPYLGACGVFPPLHLLNWLLRRGGGDGGMSPGASWEPFEISPAEYEAVVAQVLSPDRRVLESEARYFWQEFVLDHEFDQDADWFTWTKRVCAKHRAAWHERLRRIGR